MKYKKGFKFEHDGTEYECLIADEELAIFGEVLRIGDFGFVGQKNLFSLIQDMSIEDNMSVLGLIDVFSPKNKNYDLLF